MKSIFKLFNAVSNSEEVISRSENYGLSSVVSHTEPQAPKEESGKNMTINDVFSHATSFLTLPEVAVVDGVSQGIKKANEIHWQKGHEKYFKASVPEGISARDSYITKAKEQDYYVIGKRVYTKRPTYDALKFINKPPKPLSTFPTTDKIKVGTSLEDALQAIENCETVLANTDLEYQVMQSYYGGKHHLFAIKSSNQKPLDDPNAEISQEQIKSIRIVN